MKQRGVIVDYITAKQDGYEVVCFDFSELGADQEPLVAAFATLIRVCPEYAEPLRCLYLLARSASFVEVHDFAEVYDFSLPDWPEFLNVDAVTPRIAGAAIHADVVSMKFLSADDPAAVAWAEEVVAAHAKNFIVLRRVTP